MQRLLWYSKVHMTKLVIANWKSHKSLAALDGWFADFKAGMQEGLQQIEAAVAARAEVQVMIAPSFPSLSAVADRLSTQRYPVDVALAVQDLSPFPAGKYTGAVSVQNLEGIPVEYALVGHSERRLYFHETHQDVARKVEQALSARITPVVCVDEDYIDAQASAIDSALLQRCVVAYEPLAAIGTGQNADVGTVKNLVSHIKQVFGDVPVIYGGSVTPQNVHEYLLVAQGVLVGGSSLDGKEFAGIVCSTLA